jgi:hypothetical protein
MDLVVENLALQGRNIFPNVVSLEAHNFLKFSPYNDIKDEHHHEFTLTLGQIQADMRDVAFYFRRKSGIPKIKDSGLADVLIGGQGLTVYDQLIRPVQHNIDYLFCRQPFILRLRKTLHHSSKLNRSTLKLTV